MFSTKQYHLIRLRLMKCNKQTHIDKNDVIDQQGKMSVQ